MSLEPDIVEIVSRTKALVASAIAEVLIHTRTTQTVLAERMRVSRPRVNQILSTTNNTTIETLVRVAYALGYCVIVKFEKLPDQEK